MKSKLLLFDTDFNAELVTANVKDGKAKRGKWKNAKEWIVDKTIPFQLKQGWSVRPLYLLKWNMVFPASYKIQVVDIKSGEAKVVGEFPTLTKGLELKNLKEKPPEIERIVELVPMPVEFYEAKGKDKVGYDPSILATTNDVRFLKGFGKYSGGGGSERDWKQYIQYVLLLIVLGAGGFLVFLLMRGGKV